MPRQRLELACICGARLTVALRKGEGFYTAPDHCENDEELITAINSFFGEHEYCAGSAEHLPYRLTTEFVRQR